MKRNGYLSMVFMTVLVTSACTVAPKNEDVVRLYRGLPKPQSEVAVIRGFSPPSGYVVEHGEHNLELVKINDQRIAAKSLVDGGEFEIHLWPNTYTLYLRESQGKPSKSSGLFSRRGDKDELIAFKVTVEKGHVYLLGVSQDKEADDAMKQWKPFLFDRTRVVAWRGKDDREYRVERRKGGVSVFAYEELYR